jgi:CheY-like chemotaxis protein
MKGAKKVLIIDDEPDTVAFLRTWLEDHGYQTCSAMDGEQGMQVILSEKPALVLLDLKMPSQTGMQLYREIYAREELRDLPVVFITGMTEVQLVSSDGTALPEPAARLDKPIDLNALRAIIERVIG